MPAIEQRTSRFEHLVKSALAGSIPVDTAVPTAASVPAPSKKKKGTPGWVLPAAVIGGAVGLGGLGYLTARSAAAAERAAAGAGHAGAGRGAEWAGAGAAHGGWAPPPPPPPTYQVNEAYEYFGKRPGTPMGEMVAEFKRRMMHWHPDRQGGNRAKAAEISEMFDRIRRSGIGKNASVLIKMAFALGIV